MRHASGGVHIRSLRGESRVQTWANSAAVSASTSSSVAIQDANWRRKTTQLTPLTPSSRPTPMMAPVMHWLEEVGRPYLQVRCTRRCQMCAE